MTRFTPVLLVLLACGAKDDTSPATTPSTGASTASLTTWDDGVGEFFQTYCVSCHAESPTDFNLYADVVANSVKARCGVSPVELDDCTGWPPAGQFPAGNGPMPSDAEREAVVAWIEAGLPEQ